MGAQPKTAPLPAATPDAAAAQGAKVVEDAAAKAQAAQLAALARERGLPLRGPDGAPVWDKSLGEKLEAAGWTWCEARVRNARGKPLRYEAVLLFGLDGRLISEGVTDKDGVVRLWEPPPPPKPSYQPRKPSLSPQTPSLLREAMADNSRILVLPDVLEAFDAAGDRFPLWGKNKGKRDDRRRWDTSIHCIPMSVPRFDVTPRLLTPEEKFQYVRAVYAANNAVYKNGQPVYFGALSVNATPKQLPGNWLISRAGTSCNVHVNFFLGYWFNYNAQFSPDGTSTAMAYLTMLDSGKDPFWRSSVPRPDPKTKKTPAPYTHRGYKEFVTPVTGFQGFNIDKGASMPARSASTALQAEKYVDYIRMSGQFFEWKTGKPTPAWGKLLDALGDFNVYSLSDFYVDPADGGNWYDNQVKAVVALRAWLLLHRAEAPHASYTTKVDRPVLDPKTKQPVLDQKSKKPLTQTVTINVSQLTDADIGSLTIKNDICWEIIWKLDDSRPADADLLTSLRGYLNMDHHAGVIVKRAPDRGPTRSLPGDQQGPPIPVEMWKLSADGPPGKKIELKKYETDFWSSTAAKNFVHLGIWRLKPLDPGGMAPLDPVTQASKGKIDLDQVPRFIESYVWK